MQEKKVVLVKFGSKIGSKSDEISKSEYSYFTLHDVKEGDLVCVDTSHGYSLAVVTSTIGLTLSQNERAEKFIVDIIETDEHESRMEVQKQIQEIRNVAQQEMAKLNEFAVLAQFYGKNDKITGLLDNLAKLDPDYKGLLPAPAKDIVDESENKG